MIYIGLEDLFVCSQRKDYQYNFNHWEHCELAKWQEPLSTSRYTPIGPTILVEWLK